MTSSPPDAQALLDAWRQRGADRIDPVGFGVIDALHRRAARYEGKVRQRLNARLATLMQTYADKVAAAARGNVASLGDGRITAGPAVNSIADAAPATPRGAGSAAPRRQGNDRVSAPHRLGELTAYIAARRAAVSAGATAPPWTGHAYPELPLLDEVREIWGRLSADLKLQHFEQDVPQNAGPLNSIHLVHRALSHMRATSPGYLHHFLAHAEALAWLEVMDTDAEAVGATPARPGAARPSSTRKKPAKPKKKPLPKAAQSS